MKRFYFALITLILLGWTQVQAQTSAAPADYKLAPQPALVLPPVIIASPANPAATPVSKADSTDKNHSSAASNVKPAAVKTEAETAPLPKPVAPSPLTETYRVGPGDVLDVRLLNFSSRQSSLFTVQADGGLTYPYLSEPLKVEGLTAEEVAARLNSLIKVFDQPQAVVTVRHFASHTVNVTGLAGKPGPQPLQREAVPLFVILALAQPATEAQRAVITRQGQAFREVALNQPEELNLLLEAGDEINLRAAKPAPPPAPKEFFYIIGTVNTPGQKEFHQGLTLTQAIFAAGGLSKGKDAKTRLLRQGADGRLIPAEYSLKRISQGKDPDPALAAGDRLEVIGKD